MKRSGTRRRPARVLAGMMAMLAGSGYLTAPVRAAETKSAALVPMGEIAVPIIDGSRMEGILRFTLVLRAHDADSAAQMSRQVARLRSVALIAGLDFARIRASPYRAVDVAKLAHMLDKALKTADPAIEQALIVRVGAAAAH